MDRANEREAVRAAAMRVERAEKLEQRRVRRLARRQARHEAEEAAVRAEAQADVDQRSRLRHGHQVDATILKMNAREAADEKLSMVDKLLRSWAHAVVPTPLKPLLGMAGETQEDFEQALR